MALSLLVLVAGAFAILVVACAVAAVLLVVLRRPARRRVAALQRQLRICCGQERDVLDRVLDVEVFEGGHVEVGGVEMGLHKARHDGAAWGIGSYGCVQSAAPLNSCTGFSPICGHRFGKGHNLLLRGKVTALAAHGCSSAKVLPLTLAKANSCSDWGKTQARRCAHRPSYQLGPVGAAER
jgi:hypothetical protein